MSKAIIIEEFGGPEVMQMIDSQVLPPDSHEVTIHNTAIGLNFIDTYHRFGLYPLELPSHLGLEGSDVANTHINIESRATTGSTILKP